MKHPSNKASSAYLKLLEQFPPRPITSEEQAAATQEVIDALLDQEELSNDEAEYLDVLGTLLHDYEEKQDLIPDIYGVELLKVLLKERGMRQKELVPIFKTESIISAIMNGQRKFTVEHIQGLAEFFHCSTAVFFPRDEKTSITE